LRLKKRKGLAPGNKVSIKLNEGKRDEGRTKTVSLWFGQRGELMKKRFGGEGVRNLKKVKDGPKQLS